MLVIVLSVKYNDVTYLDRSSGPPSGLVQLLRENAVHVYGISMCSAVCACECARGARLPSLFNHVKFFVDSSCAPIAYHMHASQCAISVNVAMSNSNTAPPYSLYLSNLRTTRTNRSNRAVLSRPMSVVVCRCVLCVCNARAHGVLQGGHMEKVPKRQFNGHPRQPNLFTLCPLPVCYRCSSVVKGSSNTHYLLLVCFVLLKRTKR